MIITQTEFVEENDNIVLVWVNMLIPPINWLRRLWCHTFHIPYSWERDPYLPPLGVDELAVSARIYDLKIGKSNDTNYISM